MDKILKRAQYAKRYDLRREAREAAARYKFRLGRFKREKLEVAAERQKEIKASRIARREDWLLGPLAPRRDVGQGAETYGTLSARFLKGPETPNPPRRPKRSDSRKRLGIVRGDRVAITGQNERDRGRIGYVKEVRQKGEEVVIDRLNLGDVAVPAHLLISDPDKTPTRTVEFPVPLASVRLVHGMKDPVTKQKQDKIIESVSVRICHHNTDWGRHLLTEEYGRRYRVVTDTKEGIPWPSEEATNERLGPDPTKKADPETHSPDTPANLVEEETWVPTLIREPFPSGVIDELRNKYSKYRVRHEPSYVAHMERKAAKVEQRAERKRVAMMSPMDEWRARKDKEVKERAELSEGLLEGIGRIMAENREGWMDRGGRGTQKRQKTLKTVGIR